MYKLVFASLLCLTSLSTPLMAKNQVQYVKRSTKKHAVSHFTQKRSTNSSAKEAPYEFPTIDPVITRYFDEDHIYLEFEMPEGIEIPPEYQFYTKLDAAGCLIETKITDPHAFLDSKGNPLTSFDIFIDAVNKGINLEISITCVTTVIEEDWAVNTKHQSETVLTATFDQLQIDTSSTPGFFTYEDTDQIGVIQFKIK